MPIRLRPDWAAEILSPATARYDLVDKLRTLEKAGVPYDWVIDPEHEVLTVYRLGREGYVNALTAGVGDKVRAEPFESAEISIAALFGHDERLA
jgi:Uma2 family endonuclease